jgi:hypothetical protein
LIKFKFPQIAIEPGCIERCIWGEKETGKQLCRDCGATYESHCVCNATKRRTFVILNNRKD